MGTSHSRLWAITIPLSLPLLAFTYYRWRQGRLRKIELYEQVGHVAGLYVYPVKSCAGISLETADCFTEGLQFDRSVYLFVCKNVMDFHYYAKDRFYGCLYWFSLETLIRTRLLIKHKQYDYGISISYLPRTPWNLENRELGLRITVGSLWSSSFLWPLIMCSVW